MSLRSDCYRELRHALADGRVVRTGVCSCCGYESESKDIHPHHPNYYEPLNIMWLCVGCHQKWHHEHGPAVGGDLSSLALRIEHWGTTEKLVRSFVAELSRQVRETGRFMGESGMVTASQQLKRILGYRRIVQFERVR
ncbi:MAG TPA: hypothetical protein VN666_21705 [Nitrospira sp.]|nr:hypothetical protein [Nitrospira sp.]